MARLKTVTINTENGPVVINASDYDESKHTLAPLNSDALRSTPTVNSEGLRLDGPTIAEFVAAGYLAANYPPTGYASRSTPEEIAAASAPAAPPTPPPAAPGAADNSAAPVKMAVVTEGKGKAARSFVVNADSGERIVADGVEAKGYASDGEAWQAIIAMQTPAAS